MTATYIKLLFMALFWGGTFIAGRILAAEVGPFCGAFLRFFVASVLLTILLFRLERPLSFPGKKHLFPLFVMGMTGVFLYNVFFLKGLKLIEAGRASIIIANNPIFIALMSAVIFRERLNVLKIAGILVSVSGAVIVITRGRILEGLGGGFGWGEIYIFGCVASWVTYSLLGKAVMAALSPLAAVTYSALAGALCLFPPAIQEGLFDGQPYSFQAWVSIFYLGVFGTVLGFLWYYEGIRRIGPVRAGLFINFVPISAVVLSFFILGEPLTLSLLIGAVLVSSGVYLTTLGAYRF
ncbi:MAG: DMT family transporter [Deltaproteobacteria bacterium]|nr:DMT family transporter [Deltaproteobacteria bacterium]MBW1954634.1 DMT family transporter [Deltaproteobacteria bacterium]MBW2040486.1 DMT family transporter [Deltaproteobacteria bacterium]MBW2131354.1 DMT family transporter [Deltaproteobacteria bacterium]